MALPSGKRVSILFSFILGLVFTSSLYGGEALPKPVDLTKPHGFIDPEEGVWLYNIGPTGMIGLMMGGLKGHQIHVRDVAKGSPAEGKMEIGDVILGVSGKRFKKTGENMVVTIGNAIDEAEKNENGGKLTFTVWRDANYKKRDALTNIDVKGMDISKYFKVIEADTAADLERYKTQEQVKKGATEAWKDHFEKFPIDAEVLEITLTLAVMGSYSDTSPWDCPKVKKIRENAYPHLERLAQDKKGLPGWRKGTIGLALLASGKPEHVEMVKRAVHKDKKLLAGFEPNNDGWSGSAWFTGYRLCFLGEYYLRTKDDAVFKGLAAWARGTAKIQCGGGTWGHSCASRGQNFGYLHGPAPGYGAMNQAGGPCFFGLTLAQKAGVNEPIVDDAIRRSIKFNSSYVDKGGIPYGFHGAVMHEDSNGKNGPPGLALRMVGEYDKAKYFAMACSVASSWGYRGGHGDGTFGNYWPQLTSNLAGKQAVIPWMKVMRPYYTMLRRHDGTFLSISAGNSGGIGCLFNPTAMYMLHYSLPMAKLYMTGRDPVPEMQATARDIMHLKDRIGVSSFKFREAKTDEILSRLDTFSPQQRRSAKKGYLGELVKRYNAGEKDIVPKLLKLLNHENFRIREAALYTISACGQEPATLALPRAIELLRDPTEIVRMAAVSVVKKFAAIPYTEAELALKRPPPQEVNLDKVLKPLFQASLKHYPNDTNDNMNTPYVLMKLLINTKNPFARDPFGQGQDEEEVRRVLERFLTLDPREAVMQGPSKNWSRETCIKIAGPLLFTASNRSNNGIMFSGGALGRGQSLLCKYKFIEGIEGGIVECNKIARQRRDVRPRCKTTGRQGSWFPAPGVKVHKGVGKRGLPWMRDILVERMNLMQCYFIGRDKRAYIPLKKAIDMIEQNPTPDGWVRLGDLAKKAYWAEADAKGGKEAQIKFCQSTLEPKRKTWFRQMAAMDRLVKLKGTAAIADLVPYINHRQWRFHDHSRALIMKMAGAGPELAKLAMSKDDDTAIGALELLGARGDKEGVAVARKLLSNHKNGMARGAAAQAIYGGSNGSELGLLIKSIQDANDADELEGYERALLMGRKDEAQADAVSAAAKKAVDEYPIAVRRSLYYVIGQLGGKEGLAFLKGLVDTEDNQEFYDVVEAMSWSPEVSATKIMLDLLKGHQGTARSFKISTLSQKRMVNGAEKLGKVPDDVNLDFAEAHLKVVRNLEVMKYMGYIHRGRSLQILFKYMKLGPAKVTATAANSITRAADELDPKLPLEERREAARVLTQVMEYAKAVYMNRGPTGEGLSGKALNRYLGNYFTWKGISDRAGKNLGRIYKPEEEAIDDPEDDDIDI